jgi:hypothetical protein
VETDVVPRSKSDVGEVTLEARIAPRHDVEIGLLERFG